MNKNRKGFTIVELVIVIAIIAILAAVLIPTFASLIQKANISKDTQVIRNLNTAIATATEKPETMRDALKIAAEAGYLVDKINAAANGNDILWDSENKVFCYMNAETGAVAYIPETKVENANVAKHQFWKVYDEKHPVPATNDQTYSVYWAGTAAPSVKDYKVGFDAGNCTEALTITYTNTTAGQNVMFYMNGGKLMVNDETKSTQSLYGFAAEADITTGNECFYVYGTVAKATVNAGTVIAKKNSILVVDTAASGSTVMKDGGIVMAAAGSKLGNNVTVSDKNEMDNFALEISDAAGLAAFRDSVNAGMTYAGLTVKLTADIDLNGYCNGTRGWTPIGVYKNSAYEMAATTSFNGVFDGNGKTISNLLIYSADEQQMYGALFGNVTGATLKNFTVKGIVSGSDVAGVVGALNENCTVDNVTSYVDLTGLQGENESKQLRKKIAGIALAVKGDNVKISNCTNNGTIKTTAVDADTVGGIVALAEKNNLTITGCTNNADITAPAANNKGVAGILGSAMGENNTVTINSCKNNGTITASNNDSTKGDFIGTAGSATVTVDGTKVTGAK